MRVDKSKWNNALIKDSIKTLRVKDAIQKKDYLLTGKYPIISQEKDFISGYCNTKDNLNENFGEVVIFGDHTRIVKYVDFDFCIGADGVKVLRPINKLSSKYLYYFIKWSNIPSNGYSRHFKFLRDIRIQYPEDKSIQQKIAAELDSVQEMIDGYKAQLADLDALAQSIFLDMFGDPITNPKGWKLSNILSFVDEITSSKRIFANEYVKEGIPFYRIKEIIEKANQRPISVELFITEDRYSEIKASFGVPQINDLLITAVGSIGEIWIVDNDMPFYFKDGNVIWLKTSKDAVSIYLKEVLFHIIANTKDKMNGAAYSALTIVKLKAINIPNPPLCFQQQFAKQVKAIEQQKELIRQQLADAETLMAERMQYYFS